MLLHFFFVSRMTFFPPKSDGFNAQQRFFLPLPRTMWKWYCLIYTFFWNCLHFFFNSRKNVQEFILAKLFAPWINAFHVGSLCLIEPSLLHPRLIFIAFQIDLIAIYFRNKYLPPTLATGTGSVNILRKAILYKI